MNTSALKKIYKPDIMENAGSFSNKLSISQAVKFFERRSVAFTKTMIQNYVRVRLLPRPCDGRFYTKDHLYMLAVVAQLKAAYAIDELRALFLIIMKDMDSFEDAALTMQEAYEIFRELYNGLFEELLGEKNEAADALARFAERGEAAERFAGALDYMTRSVVYRQLALDAVEN